jgi:hypothetical protein
MAAFGESGVDMGHALAHRPARRKQVGAARFGLAINLEPERMSSVVSPFGTGRMAVFAATSV